MAEPSGPDRPDERELQRRDLEAVLEARRELGLDYEPALVESFVDKVEAAIESRVDARMAQAQRDDTAERQHQKQQLTLGIVSLATGVPITAVAGGVGDGLLGIVVAWAGIAAVNFAHARVGPRRP